MAREDIFQVRHQSIPTIGEAQADRAIMNKFGSQVVTDLLTQWLLSGYCFHMQLGTEDAPIDSTTAIDDALAWGVADNGSGVLVPLRYEVNIATFTTATLAQAMLEADMAKLRYSSGGTAYTPRQMNGAASGAAAASGPFYVGTDVTVLAKTAVPSSIELARRTFQEDVIADPGNGLLAGERDVFNIRSMGGVIIPQPGSAVLHFGSATADVTGYGVFQFAQFATALAW